MTNCLMCDRGTLKPTDESYLVGQVFEMWSHSVQFSALVKGDYDYSQRVSLHQCDSCSLGVFLPLVPGSGRFYQELQDQAGEWYYHADKWEFNRALNDLKGCQSVLEIGCGVGHFLDKVRTRLAPRVLVGTELNDTAASRARERGMDVSASDLEDIAAQFPEGFDAVCAFQVLEHLPDPALFLRQVSSLVRPGGTVVITVPNAGGVIRHQKPYLHDIPPHHLTRWHAETIRSSVERFGLTVGDIAFEPLAIYHYGWLLPLWAEHRWAGVPRTLSRRLAAGIGRILSMGRVRSIPFLNGHTLYARLRPIGI